MTHLDVHSDLELAFFGLPELVPVLGLEHGPGPGHELVLELEHELEVFLLGLELGHVLELGLGLEPELVHGLVLHTAAFEAPELQVHL